MKTKTKKGLFLALFSHPLPAMAGVHPNFSLLGFRVYYPDDAIFFASPLFLLWICTSILREKVARETYASDPCERPAREFYA